MPASQKPWAYRIVSHSEEAPEELIANDSPQLPNRHSDPAPRPGKCVERGRPRATAVVGVHDLTGRRVDGHLRVELAEAQGQPTIPVVYVELSEEEERIVLATLDPIGAMPPVDRERLSELLQGIDNPDLGGLLEAVARANHLALDFGSAGLTDPDEVLEPPVEPTSKPGDLWTLGDHRLLCATSQTPKMCGA